MLAHRPVTPHAMLCAQLNALHQTMTEGQAEPAWLAALAQCQALVAPLDAYLAEQATPPSTALQALEVQTNALDWAAACARGTTTLQLEKEMVSGAVEGQLLKMLTALTGAKRVLEIGAFTGYASLAMAEALPAEGQLVACEFDAFAADFAQQQWKNSPHGHKITVRVGDAQTTLEALQAEGASFDLIFLDADKTNYLNYYQTVMEGGLLRMGGLLAVDNTLYMGQVYGAGPITPNGTALRAFNTFVQKDERVEQVLLPLRDGLTLIRRII